MQVQRVEKRYPIRTATLALNGPRFHAGASLRVIPEGARPQSGRFDPPSIQRISVTDKGMYAPDGSTSPGQVCRHGGGLPGGSRAARLPGSSSAHPTRRALGLYAKEATTNGERLCLIDRPQAHERKHPASHRGASRWTGLAVRGRPSRPARGAWRRPQRRRCATMSRCPAASARTHATPGRSHTRRPL
jgi:hypothetical protein